MSCPMCYRPAHHIMNPSLYPDGRPVLAGSTAVIVYLDPEGARRLPSMASVVNEPTADVVAINSFQTHEIAHATLFSFSVYWNLSSLQLTCHNEHCQSPAGRRVAARLPFLPGSQSWPAYLDHLHGHIRKLNNTHFPYARKARDVSSCLGRQFAECSHSLPWKKKRNRRRPGRHRRT